MGISASQINPQYNPTANSLSFALDYSDKEFTQTLPLSFGSSLGPLSFQGMASATVDGTVQLNATLGIDLGGLQSVLTGTAPAPSNGQLTSDAHFTITVGTQAPVNITVTAASTRNNQSTAALVGDLNTALSSAGLGPTVVAALNAAGDITLTNPFGQLLQISAPSGDPTLTQLFLPTTAAVQDFVDNTYLATGSSVTVTAAVSATSINGSAGVGIVGVGIQNGNVSLSATTGVTLNSTSSNGQVSLSTLLQNATSDLTIQSPQATLQGQFPLTLSGISLPGYDPSNPPAIALSLANDNDLTSITATPNSAFTNILSGLTSFNVGDLSQAFQNVETSLLQGNLLGALSTPLPLVNKSLNDILGTTSLFNKVTTALNQVASLSALQTAVQNVLYSVVTGTTALPTNGQLTADATFQISVGTPNAANPPVTVTITAASTQTNTTATQLAAQVDTAISTALGNSELNVTLNSSGDLTITDRVGDEISITAAATDPASTQLGLSTTSASWFSRAPSAPCRSPCPLP